MKVFFKIVEVLLITPYRILKGIGRVFQKAIEIIKPHGTLEWIVLLIAVPVPFGVTALFIYKYFKQQ